MVFSSAQQVFAVCDSFGTEYRQPGTAFSQATFRLRSSGRWVRFELVATDGAKAWPNLLAMAGLEWQ